MESIEECDAVRKLFLSDGLSLCTKLSSKYLFI